MRDVVQLPVAFEGPDLTRGTFVRRGLLEWVDIDGLQRKDEDEIIDDKSLSGAEVSQSTWFVLASSRIRIRSRT